MTGLGLALCQETLTLGAVTTSDENAPFDATDEAFFNAAYEDSPVSERPVTLELDSPDAEADEELPDPVEHERLRARRARLTQTVVEIVGTLALVSSTAFGMDLVRASARAAASSSPAARHTPAQSSSTHPGRERAAARRYHPVAADPLTPGI